MTLVEFLLARLAEDAAEIAKQPDEQGEPGGIGIWSSGDALSNTEYLILSKRRALAEVDAKRKLVEVAEEFLHDSEGGTDPMAAITLRLLALPYADHPDYDPTWRP